VTEHAREGANTRPRPRQEKHLQPDRPREILHGCNRRYLEHLSTLDDFSAGVRALDRLTKPRRIDEKTVKGINFFDPVDNARLHALQNPRVSIAGIRRASLLALVEQLSPARLSRQLRRLRDIGQIKRVGPDQAGGA
jgi:hypothetical protein